MKSWDPLFQIDKGTAILSSDSSQIYAAYPIGPTKFLLFSILNVSSGVTVGTKYLSDTIGMNTWNDIQLNNGNI